MLVWQDVRRQIISALMIYPLVLGACAAPYATPTSDPLDTTLPASDSAVRRMQEQSSASMAALGDAYRQAIADGDVSDAVLLLLADGFAGTARDAEEANLRDAIPSRNSLARTPADPELIIDIVTDETPDCMIAEAEFDDRPLLAFPTAIAGIAVVVRMRRNPDDELWRIDELLSAQQADDSPIRCPAPGEISQLRATTTTTPTATSAITTGTTIAAIAAIPAIASNAAPNAAPITVALGSATLRPVAPAE